MNTPEKTQESLPEEIICYCTGTTKKKITSLIQTKKANTEQIISSTGATTGCGSCDVTVMDFIAEHSE